MTQTAAGGLVGVEFQDCMVSEMGSDYPIRGWNGLAPRLDFVEAGTMGF